MASWPRPNFKFSHHDYRIMSFGPSFPIRNFYDPPTLAQYIGYLIPFTIWGLKERQRIWAWFHPSMIFIVADGYAIRLRDLNFWLQPFIDKQGHLRVELEKRKVNFFICLYFAIIDKLGGHLTDSEFSKRLAHGSCDNRRFGRWRNPSNRPQHLTTKALTPKKLNWVERHRMLINGWPWQFGR